MVSKGFVMLNFSFNLSFTRIIQHKIVIRNFKRNKCVRVRFAPSPTGHLHLGGLRTAIYNHLFAISQKGQTILRIEDTDQERKVDGAVDKLVEDLSWCGLHYDEGPVRQSERLDLYHRRVQSLLETQHAYRCFCTSSRLDILRREAIKCGLVPKYDNRCRHLSKDEIKVRLNQGAAYCVRFKLSPTPEPFHDIIYGDISHDVASVEGDPVILKTDGFPTYHLANVVDDHDMRVTHVLRGVEWQGSTQKHLLLYRAFGWEPPRFGHLPLLLNPDGTKLSKRQGDVNVSQYRDKGIFPLALVNFVVRAGSGFDIEQWERDQTSFTLQQLAEKFDILKINGSSCKVSLDKLGTSNQLELQRQLSNATATQHLVKLVQDLVTNHFKDSGSLHSIDTSEDHIRRIIMWAQHRIQYLQELIAPEWRFLWVLPHQVKVSPEDTAALKTLEGLIRGCTAWESNELKKICRDCATASGLKFPHLMRLLRKVLSGLQEGPGVAEVMSILGKDLVLQRISAAISSSYNTAECLSNELSRNN